MRILVFLILISSNLFAQFSAMEPMQQNVRKEPVQFTHVPFLLLRFNPTTLLGYNNTFNFGAEIAPPIGKLSFAFDYGTGKGSNNLNKVVREFQGDNKNKELRAEIKAYFSDWIPFYALDKKPFGRYYSIEYINGKYDRNLGVPIGNFMLPNKRGDLFREQATTEQTHVVHLKIGKHFHIHRHLFIDVFGGLGAGYSKFSLGNKQELLSEKLYNPIGMGFLSDKRYNDLKTEKIFFSKTLGLRIVVPI